MRRLWSLGLAAGALAAVLLTGSGSRALEPATPFAGTWRLVTFSSGFFITQGLIRVEEQGGKPTARWVAGGDVESATVKDVRADATALHFGLQVGSRRHEAVFYAPEGQAPARELRGSMQVRSRRELAFLVRTEQKSVDKDEIEKAGPGADVYRKVRRIKDPVEKAAVLQKIVDSKTLADQPLQYPATVALLEVRGKTDGTPDDLRKLAERVTRLAAAYGPEMEQYATYTIAHVLVVGKHPALAVDYARQAEKRLGPRPDPAFGAALYTTLAAALRQAGQADEAREVQARAARLDEVLDQQFLEKAIPFKPTSYAGRQARSDRVAVLELFTGAECPPCVSADVAFDALLETYKPTEVVQLEYHLHIPRPDPMTLPANEDRAEYYDVEGTPTFLLNGKQTPELGGSVEQSKDDYRTLRNLINERLDEEAGARLALKVQRQADEVRYEVEVTDLARPGGKVRLRFVLAEEVVRYPGGNGQRLHHHVVRAYPGGLEGQALPEKTAKHGGSFNVAELRKTQDAYLAEFVRKRDNFFHDTRPLDLKHLKLIALIQDDQTKEILQAAQADVPE